MPKQLVKRMHENFAIFTCQIFLSAVPHCYIARVPPNVNAMYPTRHGIMQVKNRCPPDVYINLKKLAELASLETTTFQVCVKIKNV